MMRLDKYLCECSKMTRTEAKDVIKKGMVTINNDVCTKADMKVNECYDSIICAGNSLHFQKNYYFILHKPAGLITATEDSRDKTVLDLFHDIPVNGLFPVGRLDKDTEGLLIITNDGALSHSLLSPKKHVSKTYFVRLRDPITGFQVNQLEKGVDIGDDKVTLPAKVTILEENAITLTITEGRYHQVKRMLLAVSNEVTYLKRIAMGHLSLPSDLTIGNYRVLTEQELKLLTEENE